ncbi:MAG TPA: DUF4917 family protein, partial [Gemmatimonadales bacterium]|nr:DUF4917 family protein [Gemmatimonadales bacterium]
MADIIKVLEFKDAMLLAEESSGKRHILLGNGFSIGAHPLFKYDMLYEQARKAGLPKHVQEVFDHFGTANFEAVLRNLDEGDWLAGQYKLQKTDAALDMKADYERVKEALAEAVANSHPALPSIVGDDKLAAAAAFMARFDNVYTSNYDLLPYWALFVNEPFPFLDGFGREADTDDSYCVFLPTSTDQPHIYFLHGALHLYLADGEVRKLVWNTTGIPLMTQVKSALDQKQYPLVVTEGDSLSKRARIESSSYLSYCHRRFENIQGSLFIYGSSLSSQDDHIWDAIAFNTSLPHLFVSLRGDPASKSNKVLIARAEGFAT